MSKKEKKKDTEKKGKKNLVTPPVTPPEDIPAPESTPDTPPPLPKVVKPKKAAAPKAKATKPKAPKKEKTEVLISNDDIALRAYFIAERRAQFGWHGDQTGDWVEAERQLREEAARAKKKK